MKGELHLEWWYPEEWIYVCTEMRLSIAGMSDEEQADFMKFFHNYSLQKPLFHGADVNSPHFYVW